MTLWQVEKGTQNRELYGLDHITKLRQVPTALTLSALDNNVMAVALEDKTIHIYNFMATAIQARFTQHNALVTSLLLEGELMVSGSADG